ncbi:MAG: purine/pyrimidine permease [Eubacteriales bacterium]
MAAFKPRRADVVTTLKSGPLHVDTILYSLQYLVVGIANCAAVPVVVGTSLGMDSAGVAAFAQRTFFFSGLACLIQAICGHRYPIFEGPAGIWFSTFIVLAGMAEQVGKSLSVLCTDLETGLIAAGVLSILLGVFRLMPYVRRLFTPVVNGTFLILLALQFSGILTRALLSTGLDGASFIALDKTAVFFITSGVTIVLSLKAKSFIQSIAILIGAAVGWLAALLYGLAPSFPEMLSQHVTVFMTPELFAWGMPTFDPGVTLTALIAGTVVLSNLVASVSGMQDLADHPKTDSAYNKTVVCTGIADIFAGCGSVVGFVPYASSIGFTALTGIFAITPFIIGSALLALFGVIPVVGHFFAAMPITVGYAILFSLFVMILGLGIRDCTRDGLGTREMVILGISIMVGNGISFLPAQSFAVIPLTLSYFLSNGLIVGVILSMLFEHVVFRSKNNV